MHITIASMNANGKIDENVKKIAQKSKHVILQTQLFENMLPTHYSTLDNIFKNAENFDDLTMRSCELLMRDKTLFITLGCAYQNAIALKLCELTLNKSGTISIEPHDNIALCLAMEQGFYTKDSGICMYTASNFDVATNTDNALVISEVDTKTIASELKIKLSEYYDDKHSVFVANIRDKTSIVAPLHDLDCLDSYGYYTSVVISPAKLEKKIRYTYNDLINIMDKLRGKNGCPWDKEQTHESLKRYLVEESYEVLEAIDLGDTNALFDELGDVLLQIVFHAKIAQQHSEFSSSDVTSAICNKMISRHTHIFGDESASTPGEVIKNWEAIKRKEKSHQTQTEVLQGVPKSMPALMRSGKVAHKAGHIGFDFRKIDEAIFKLKEEIAEVEADIANGNNMYEECGDLLFSAVNVTRMLNVEPEIALQNATDKFIGRFAHVERLAKEKNIDMKMCDIDTLEDLWNSAKKMT